jgi:uncharacterized protein YkwD
MVVFFLIIPSAPVAAADCTVSGGDLALDGEEQAMLNGINAWRQQHGLPAYAVSPALTRSAAWMSKDMADKNYFSHSDSLGRSAFARMADCGYGHNTSKGENVAAGYGDAASTLNQWKNSPSHNANLLSSGNVVIGLARHYNAGATWDWYWTMDIGGFNDSGGGGVASGTTSLYRLFAWDWLDHFYTANAVESDYWSKNGWVYQGVCCQIFSSQVTGTWPLYRLWSHTWGDHMYTLDGGERDNLISWGWNYEGVVGYCYPPWAGQPAGTKPLHRLWSWNYLDHLYTTSEAERASLVTWGWNYERVECYTP